MLSQLLAPTAGTRGPPNWQTPHSKGGSLPQEVPELLTGHPKNHSEIGRVSMPPNPPWSRDFSNRESSKKVLLDPSQTYSWIPTLNSKTNCKISTVKCRANELPHTGPPQNKNNNKKPNRTICCCCHCCFPSWKFVSNQTTRLKYCLSCLCPLERGVRNSGSGLTLASLSTGRMFGRVK